VTPAVFRIKHDLWLELLFTSFMIGDEGIKSELYDFSQTAFRHMRWIARELKAQGLDYSYDRTVDLGRFDTVFDALHALAGSVTKAMEAYPASPLSARMSTDERYLLFRLERMLEQPGLNARISAFDRHCTLPDKPLERTQTDALIRFLFEETYKEYELILVYAYMQNASVDVAERDIYQDLIDESHFHLKSFGNLMAKLGLLALPRPLHERTYKINDVAAFIRNGIEEEENAKELCRALAGAVGDEELSSFFDFINFQESYHIELMKKLL
jgi:rubrerythrin